LFCSSFKKVSSFELLGGESEEVKELDNKLELEEVKMSLLEPFPVSFQVVNQIGKEGLKFFELECLLGSRTGTDSSRRIPQFLTNNNPKYLEHPDKVCMEKVFVQDPKICFQVVHQRFEGVVGTFISI